MFMTKNLVISQTKLFRLEGQNLIKNMDVFVSEKLGGSQLYKIIHARIFYHVEKKKNESEILYNGAKICFIKLAMIYQIDPPVFGYSNAVILVLQLILDITLLYPNSMQKVAILSKWIA